MSRIYLLGKTNRGTCCVEAMTLNLLLDLFSEVSLRHLSRDVTFVIKYTAIKLRCSCWPEDIHSKSSELDCIGNNGNKDIIQGENGEREDRQNRSTPEEYGARLLKNGKEDRSCDHVLCDAVWLGGLLQPVPVGAGAQGWSQEVLLKISILIEQVWQTSIITPEDPTLLLVRFTKSPSKTQYCSHTTR